MSEDGGSLTLNLSLTLLRDNVTLEGQWDEELDAGAEGVRERAHDWLDGILDELEIER
jgi:hypothetical protein